MKVFAMVVAGVIVAAFAIVLPAAAPDPQGQYEARVFLLDKSGKSVDLAGITAMLTIQPKEGEKRTIRMEITKPGPLSPMGSMPRSDPRAIAQEQPRSGEGAKLEHAVCGQVKEMDNYLVEFVVVPGGISLRDVEKGLGIERGGDRRAPEEPEAMIQEHGMLHDHGGPYFRAELGREIIAPNQPVNFKSDVQFTIQGETKWAKGFDYPLGLYKDVSGNLTKELNKVKELIQNNQWDKVIELSRKVKRSVEAFPMLWFEKDQDRTEFEKARSECVTATEQVTSAAESKNKDLLLKSIDRCKDKLDELSDQAKDAKGARLEVSLQEKQQK
ncbi:MAG: hypothetical protein HYY16_13385 [Planctomycetes bacterium]|nr:hypothetical protein [Planctomycetota bacterium]